MANFIAALNWPTTGLVLGLIGILVFSPQLKALLNRTKKIDKLGWEAQEPQQLPAVATTTSGTQDYLKAFENVLVLDQEERIRADLESRKILSPNEREQVLIKTLAAFQVALNFEQVYNAIYGSQVALLVHLNARQAGDSEASIKPFYENAKAAYPIVHEHTDFDAYLGYLVAANLVERNSNAVAITLTGREFLKYLLDARKTIPSIG